MKFVAFWTVEDAGPYKFVRLFRTRARFFVRLPLKEKPADAVLSAVVFCFCRKWFLKICSPKVRNLASLPSGGNGVKHRKRCRSDEGEIAPISLENKDATFPLESYWQSFVDPCVATLLALIAFAPLISIGFDYGFHPPLRMTR